MSIDSKFSFQRHEGGELILLSRHYSSEGVEIRETERVARNVSVKKKT